MNELSKTAAYSAYLEREREKLEALIQRNGPSDIKVLEQSRKVDSLILLHTTRYKGVQVSDNLAAAYDDGIDTYLGLKIVG